MTCFNEYGTKSLKLHHFDNNNFHGFDCQADIQLFRLSVNNSC